jgi:hypothetical protein
MALQSLICDHEAAYMSGRKDVSVLAVGGEAYYVSHKKGAVEIERQYDEAVNLIISTSVQKHVAEVETVSGRIDKLHLGHVFRYVKTL